MQNSLDRHSISRRLFCAGSAASIPAATGVFASGNVQSANQYLVEQARALGGKGAAIRVLAPSGCEANLHPVIQAFHRATGINVELVQTPVDELNTQISLDWLNKSADYDLVLPATFGLPDLVNAGALRPIDDFVQKHESPRFRDGMLFQTGDSFDDKTYGFQTDGDAYVMFYNDSLMSDKFEKDGYHKAFDKPLDIPLTWSELDRQIEWFHRPDEGVWGGLLFRTSAYVGWEWWVRFHAKGLWPMDGDLRPLISGEAGIEALEEMIRVTEFLKNGVSHYGLFENWEQYAKGNVFANICWGGSQKFFNRPESNVKGKLRYGPTPGGIVDGSLLVTPYFNWGWTYAVFAGSSNAELAYLFALFASSPEISTLAVQEPNGFFDPFRVEHYEDEVIREIYSDAFLKVHSESMRNAIPDLYLANQSQYLGALNTWVQRALDKKVTASEAMKRIAQSWELTTARSDPIRQKERWRQLRLKYPEEVQRRLSSEMV